MTPDPQPLAWLGEYGLPALFVIVVGACVGLPLPGTLSLIAAGALIERGVLGLEQVVGVALIAALTGDQLGYLLGRYGGRKLVERIRLLPSGHGRLARAEAATQRWGGPAIFFSRWVIPPLAPMLNLTSGLAAFRWPAFLLYDATGALIWVFVYVTLGRLFHDQLTTLTTLLSELAWLLLAMLVAAAVWMGLRRRRSGRDSRGQPRTLS